MKFHLNVGVVALSMISHCSHLVSGQVTSQECEDAGGVVVGDIGNGAIFAVDYVCDNTGAAPTDVIVSAPGEPINTDGAVCCGGPGTGILQTGGGDLPFEEYQPFIAEAGKRGMDT